MGVITPVMVVLRFVAVAAVRNGVLLGRFLFTPLTRLARIPTLVPPAVEALGYFYVRHPLATRVIRLLPHRRL